jgi:folate-dependent phosphoribosylglycinamide formyltransferase PurN
MKKILFLGYSFQKSVLLKFINEHPKVKLLTYSNKPLNIKRKYDFDLIICFGYRHIISKEFLSKFKNRIINLHISYLPYNRGAHPNVWSFLENTPSGVTIHRISDKIDQGDIIFQKKINFNLYKYKNKLTFKNTYEKLIVEIEKLFKNKFDIIINNKYVTKKQKKVGTIHKQNDIPIIIKKWSQNVYKTKIKYNLMQKNKNKLFKKSEKIVDQIQKIRSKNNVNWMNLLKLALQLNPKETSLILSKIYQDDQKISKLIQKLRKVK